MATETTKWEFLTPGDAEEHDENDLRAEGYAECVSDQGGIPPAAVKGLVDMATCAVEHLKDIHRLDVKPSMIVCNALQAALEAAKGSG